MLRPLHQCCVRSLFDVMDQIEKRKDLLIADKETRLQQKTTRSELFTIRWRLG